MMGLGSERGSPSSGSAASKAWENTVAEGRHQQRGDRVADHLGERLAGRDLAEVKGVRERLEPRRLVRRDGPPARWVNVPTLTHRAEPGRDRLSGLIPAEPPVHRFVRVVAVAVTEGAPPVGKIVEVLLEEVRHPPRVLLTDRAAAVVDRSVRGPEQVADGPADRPVGMVTNSGGHALQ